MTRALKRPHLSHINTGGLGKHRRLLLGLPGPTRAGRLRAACNPTADAALNSQFTFFSSMARSRKRRSQFDSGVSFMLSNQETNKYWNPQGKQNSNLFPRAQARTAAQRIDVIKARWLKLGKQMLAGRR